MQLSPANVRGFVCMTVCYWRGPTLAISDAPQNTDLSHIPFYQLPLESETHCLWGLQPRNENRVGLKHTQNRTEDSK